MTASMQVTASAESTQDRENSGPVQTSDFSVVLDAELRTIAGSRPVKTTVPDAQTAYQRAQKMDLVGLTFSGGGIRSATFNLGILQSLASLNLLGRFDYLSTVSGGGYIGAWLTAMLHRHGKSQLEAVHGDLLPPGGRISGSSPGDASAQVQRRESAAVGFLRAYSNYLTPDAGLLSMDSLAAASTYVRNLVLLQAMIVALLLAALSAPRLLHTLLWASSLEFPIRPACVAIGAAVTWALGLSIAIRASRPAAAALGGNVEVTHATAITVLLLLGAFAWAILLLQWGGPQPGAAWWPWTAGGCALFSAAVPGVQVSADSKSVLHRLRPPAGRALSGALAGALLGVGFDGLTHLYGFISGNGEDIDAARWFALAIGPALVLQLAALAMSLHIGLMGRRIDYQTHEWWSRLGALMAGGALAYTTLAVISIYGPAVLEYAASWVAYAGGGVWAASSLWGLIKGASASTSGKDATWTERLLAFAPYVFVVGLAVALSWGSVRFLEVSQGAHAEHATTPASRPFSATREASHLRVESPGSKVEIDFGGSGNEPDFQQHVDHVTKLLSGSPQIQTGLFVGGLIVFTVLMRRLDINLFSLHNFYRNRLTRCYLGAARMGTTNNPRSPDMFTGFDPSDDIPLSDLAGDEGGNNPVRPFHILNTTINLTVGGSLGWQTRKGGSFFFSPQHCGYELPQTADRPGTEGGFVRTSCYMADGTQRHGPMLGSVMAVSGAAASPNSGFHTSPAIAFILTLFNVRLGRWCANTKLAEPPRSQAPAWGFRYLLSELFGSASVSSPYVYLSDGGHFDNLGIYELARRRVRHIIACDCGQDTDGRYEDLADTIRKCYTDFGVRIEIDVEALEQVSAGSALHKGHFVRGRVHYPPIAGARSGTADSSMAQADEDFCGSILLIKPTLSHALFEIAPDIRQYAQSNPDFPQQTTADQWFDEAQFESYRKLGNYIGNLAFSDFDHHLKDCPKAGGGGSDTTVRT